VRTSIETIRRILLFCILFFCILFFGMPARAQSGLEHPQLGMMIDRSGVARPAYGVAASVTVGGAAAQDVLSIACSRQLCLMKTDSALLASDTTIPTVLAPPLPMGPALIALDGASAFVYFMRTKQLVRWHDGQLDPVPWEIQNESTTVIAIRAGPSGTLDAAPRVDRRVSIVRATLADGTRIVIGSLPDDTGPVLLTTSGVVFAELDKVVLRRPDGAESSFPVTNVREILRLGDRYVQIRAGDFDYALRIDSGHEQLFLLPEILQ